MWVPVAGGVSGEVVRVCSEGVEVAVIWVSELSPASSSGTGAGGWPVELGR